MVEIGKMNKLKIIKKVDFGVYLDGGKLGKILLPRRDVPRKAQIGDELEVFIYLDSEDMLIATIRKPYAMVGDFARLKVVAVNSFGAFLDWGLAKDLMVPYGEQRQKMRRDRWYIVRVYLDELSQRIVASSKLDKFLDPEPTNFEIGQQVNLFVCEEHELGFRVVVEKTHWGMLYLSEIFQPVKRGQEIAGYITNLREDGKIDVSLQTPGLKKVRDISKKILQTLEEKGGKLPVSDSSSPETIYNLFGVSKKTYKKAIGTLYKKRKILIEDDFIALNR